MKKVTFFFFLAYPLTQANKKNTTWNLSLSKQYVSKLIGEIRLNSLLCPEIIY